MYNLDNMKFKIHIDNVENHAKPSNYATVTYRIMKNVEEITFDEFSERVSTKGHSFVPAAFSTNELKAEHWKEQFIFAVDIEHAETLNEALDICRQYNIIPNFVYTTFSHTSKNHRFRLVWFMNEAIQDVRLQKLIQLSLMEFFKGADPSCKNRNRLFNGSNAGAYYINKETVLTVPNLLVAINNKLKTGTNATTKTMSFAKRVGVNIKNGYLNWDYINVTENGSSTQNIYFSDYNKNNTSNYVYNNKCASFIHYKIDFSAHYTRDDAEKFEIYKYKKGTSLIRNYDFTILENRCKLYRKAKDGTCWLNHNQMFALMTNLIRIDGGAAQIKQILNVSVPEALQKEGTLKPYLQKTDNWNRTYNQINKAGYFPMKCHTFCPFWLECENDDNIINAGKLVKGQVQKIKTGSNIRELDKIREDLKGIFDEFIAEKPIEKSTYNITVVKAPTGSGKTEEFIRIAKNNTLGVVYSAPTHKLLQNVVARLVASGLTEDSDFLVYPELPEEYEGKQLIEKLYNCGAYAKAMEELNIIAKNDKKIKLYLEKKEEIEHTDKLLLITHQRLIHCPLGSHYKKIIIDEDIILNSMLPIQTVTLANLETAKALMNLKDPDSQYTRKLNSIYHIISDSQPEIVYETPIQIPSKEMGKYLFDEIKTGHIDSNVMDFCTSGYYTRVKTKTKDYLCYIKKHSFNIFHKDTEILILSATANQSFTSKAYPEISFVDLGEIEFQGLLYQVPSRSLSRYSIQTNSKGYVNYCKNLCKKYLGEDYHMITYSEFMKDMKSDADKELHLWNCGGLDNIQDKNLAIIGTPHCPPVVYTLRAKAAGLSVNQSNLEYRRIIRNGFKFYFNTYSNDSDLMEVQLYHIESVLHQAVGRARLVNNSHRKVLLLSNLLMSQATVINLSNADIKELMECPKNSKKETTPTLE